MKYQLFKRSFCTMLAMLMILTIFPSATAESATEFRTEPMIAAGQSHTVALKHDGTVWAWGWNEFGELGGGTSDLYHITPIQVKNLNNVIAIAAGFEHTTLALRADGTVWAWGKNLGGSLGNGTYGIYRATPAQVKNLSNITAIAAGWRYSMALKEDGTVWAWGNNCWGQLGDGTKKHRTTPVWVQNLNDVTEIAAGGFHALALRNGNTVWTWGTQFDNDTGEIYTSFKPMQTENLSNITAIAAGERHSMVLRADGAVLALGLNQNGQLGDGTTISRATPALVLGSDGVGFLNLLGLPMRFGDIFLNAWYANAVQFVYENGIMSGVGDNQFNPQGTLSRAMVAAILYNYAGQPDITFNDYFVDVDEGHWSALAVSWAFGNEIVSGMGNQRFAPNENVTREQFATMLFNFASRYLSFDMNIPAAFHLNHFVDAGQVSPWAMPALRWANYNEIIGGLPGNILNPGGTATRAEAAALFMNFLNTEFEIVDPNDPNEPPDEDCPAGQFERQVFDLTNAERERHGIAPLVWHEDLSQVARAFSIDMVERDFFSHTCPDGTLPWDRIDEAGIPWFAAGENIAAGQRTPEAVVAAWMNSPGHRANILNPNFTHLGVGFHDFYWTQKFIGV